MFDWKLFLVLTAISLPGIMGTAPKLVLSIRSIAKDKLPADKELPSIGVLILILVIQNFVLGFAFAALGTFLAPKVGLEAPIFSALLANEEVWPIMKDQLWAVLGLGTGGALVFVAGYYLWYRPRLEEVTVQAMEELRQKLGLRGRLLYGGVFEEVFARWGLMSLFVWLGKIISGNLNPVIIWTGIIISGIVFGLSHLPNYLAAGCKASFQFISLMLILNLWASLIFGWLFWQYGLAAAMLAHMLFHLVWYPFDQKFS